MNSAAKISVIINPKSGHGMGLRIFDEVNEARLSNPLLKESLMHVGYTSPGDNSETLKEMAEDSDIVLICGGDGTVHRIINTIVASNVAVAAISVYPMGTGDDLARSLGIFKYKGRIVPLLEKLITAPNYADLDIFSVNDTVLFTNYVSFGYDAFALSAYESWVNRLKEFRIFEFTLLKKFLFSVIGLFSLLFYRKKIVESVSGRTCINMIVSNLRTYAGGSIVSESCSMDDERVEVSCLASKLEYLKFILNRFRLFPFDIAPVSAHTPLLLNFQGNVPVQVDGEDYTDSFKGSGEIRVTFRSAITVAL